MLKKQLHVVTTKDSHNLAAHNSEQKGDIYNRTLWFEISNLQHTVLKIHKNNAVKIIQIKCIKTVFIQDTQITECSSCVSFVLRKGKAVPLQAWSGPEGSRKLRFPDYMTTAQDGGKVVSLTHRPFFTPRKCSWYSFLLQAELIPGP